MSYGLKQYKELLEKELLKFQKQDAHHRYGPITMSEEQGVAYVQATKETLLWCLEMLPEIDK